MLTELLLHRIVRFPTSFLFTIPPTVGTRFVKGMRSVALRAIPMRIAVRIVGGDMVRFLLRAIPIMRTTCGGSEHLFADRTIKVICRRTGFIKRVSLFATFAIPDIGTGVADAHNGRVFGTIPTVGLIAHKIGFVMVAAVFAEPEVCAVCFGFIHALATFLVAVTVTAVGTFRQRRCVFLSASGAMPIMRATGTGRFRNAAAGFAIPVSAAHKIGRMMFLAGCAVPEMSTVFGRHQDLIARCAHAITRNVGVRTGVFLLIAGAIPIMFAIDAQRIGFVALFTVPRVFANHFIRNCVYLVSFVALGTIPIRCATVGRLMSVSTIGTAPGMIAMRLRSAVVARTVAVVAIGAVPITGSTQFGIRMPGLIAAATPTVFAGLSFGVTPPVAAVAIDTPPIMGAIFGFLISLHALGAEPTIVQAYFQRPMMCFFLFANGACPVMRTAFGRT